jgi:hypothetical protein
VSDSATKKIVKLALKPEIKGPMLDTSNWLKRAIQSQPKTSAKYFASAHC